MTYTSIPSVKGQITIPSTIRAKYNIGQDTPIVIEDKGNGVITMKVMTLVPQDTVKYYENEKEIGVSFKEGVDPQAIIEAIKKIDG